MSSPARPYPPLALSLVVWAVPALFYLAGFYLRVSPAVMTTELMRDFHMDATGLGNLTSFYYYSYVLMQLPVGVLVDSLGPRRLLIGGTLLAALGTFFFGLAPGFAAAAAARALVGGATAVAWVVTLKIVAHWFTRSRYALFAGITLFAGNIGALVAQVPLRLVLRSFDWRTVSFGAAALVLAMSALAFFFVHDDPSRRGFQSFGAAAPAGPVAGLRQLIGAIPGVFSYRNTWLIFLAQGGFVGAMLSFTGLWGPPFLRTRFALSPESAAAIISLMTICWATASPIAGWLSDRIGRRKPIYLGGALVAAAGWPILFYMDSLPLPAFVVLAGLTSFCCGAVIIGFAYARESVPPRFLGTISAAINMGNMMAPMILQPAIGAVLDRNWHGALAGTVKVFGMDAFHAGFALIVTWSVVSCALISLTRETGCRQNA